MKKIIALSTILIAFVTMANSCPEQNKKTDDTNTAEPIVVSATPETTHTKIQVAILLDTSGSMDGLIEQAKSRLWNIVNTLTTLKYQGKTPYIEIALYQYGSYNRYDGDYLRQVVPLTTDLDKISEELFALQIGGSEEYCGTVIRRAVKELEWGNNEADMKLIYIAGNEIFEQGNVPYKTAMKEALEKNIFVNTIHCGSRDMGIRDLWQDAAILGKGKFFNIDSDRQVRFIETPYDDKISEYNVRLNDTYIGYGSIGESKKQNQMAQDENAKSLSSANSVERVVTKSKAAYNNSNWDLVDKMKEDKNLLDKVKQEELPKELQNKTKEEIKTFITQKEKERSEIQQEISKLAKQRQDYIDQKLAETNNDTDDLGNAITHSVLAFAQQKGYEVSNN